MAAGELPKISDEDFRRLQKLMLDVSGIHMADQKRTLMAGRLMCRLRALNLDNYGDYLKLICDPAEREERRTVIDLLTTNETYFFREPQHFTVLAEWASRQRKPVHLWSAASSSGQEAFSMAMTLAEHAPTQDWSIFASDLSRRVLDRARLATYPLEQAEHFPPGWLKRHCLRGVEESAGLLRMNQALRHRVAFAEINLTRPLPREVGPFDVIFLRNVLIYFGAAEKRAIAARLVERLKPGGLLFIGHAESVHGFGLPLRGVRPSVFERQ
ncbi:CheR family methyltransferase [Phytopseudomonas dryadis]|uniref:Chemotaxis protein methyltransferase n=1 Tax=Phytopseudomonas dryadis TaxID=2487520 RepID=A0A4Q9R218_9GAMM|nr:MULTISPECIES: CheR family methyltransferase [Pseudomonas]TBU92507.1 protein-glutamate O-methyltransferase [Pseudomonas dryadis]TBV03079.1 protein-glutamate O-methyltransferase [Pseudomonas dryadis]TBV17644.1 protein-glutamate O-methyltransferase [Pseudomonas sp. FRB 230]